MHILRKETFVLQPDVEVRIIRGSKFYRFNFSAPAWMTFPVDITIFVTSKRVYIEYHWFNVGGLLKSLWGSSDVPDVGEEMVML
jgi:hypothetical protein